jgi:hypothetical protein
MFDRVIFYNHFGAGDIFESREFVRAWMKLVPASEYFYAHGKNQKILRDIPELQYTQVTEDMQGMVDVAEKDGTLLVNTWIGRNSKYVLPGIGCTVEKLFDMHNDMLRDHGFDPLPGTPLDYIPDIDYSYYNLENVNFFMSNHTERKVFISNGPVQSNQAFNFNFAPAIVRLAEAHPDISFLITSGIPEEMYAKHDNLFYTEEIIRSAVPFDLPEISYLSLFCTTLIGRNSGPHVYTWVKRNCMDEGKTNLTFSYHIACNHFVRSPILMKKYWTAVTDEDEVYRAIEEIL